MFKLSSASRARLEGINPCLLPVIELALKISLVDFGIPADGGLRTAERQKELFNQKLSKADGYHKLSAHQSGNAFDVFAYVDGKASWNELHLTHVATAILSAASKLNVPLVWGGHWRSFKDLPHFEIKRSA